MEPLLARLGKGPFFTLIAGVTSMLGILMIGIIRRNGMIWRLRQECPDARGTGNSPPRERPPPIK